MPEIKNKVKAQIAKVSLGLIEFEGLLLPDGSFAIAVPQICSLFNIPIKHSSRDIKQLLGNDVDIPKVYTTFRKNYTNILLLKDFDTLLIKLAVVKQNKVAEQILLDLAGLSLQQLYCDAFGQKFDLEDRQRFITERQLSKLMRRNLTDSILDWLDTLEPETRVKHQKYVYSTITNNIYSLCFGRKATKLKEDWKLADSDNLRDYLTYEELHQVVDVETQIMRTMDTFKLDPYEAFKQVKERFLVKVYTR